MKTLFFDLDGTIADSQEGIINSIHYMIQKQHLPLLDDDTYRQFIGRRWAVALTNTIRRCRRPRSTKRFSIITSFTWQKAFFNRRFTPGFWTPWTGCCTRGTS